MQADEINPQVQAAVDRQDRLPFPHNRRGVKFLRLLTRATMWLQNRYPPPVGTTVDRRIPTPAGERSARLYLPDTDGPVPTVVFFHGGGFVLGSIDTHDWLCRHLTRESGCGVLSVDYRLAPEHPFPAAVEDAYAAVEWTAANSEAVSGTGTIAVAGDSAGGTLAAVVALMAAECDGPEISHQALIYPAVSIRRSGIRPGEHGNRPQRGRYGVVQPLLLRERYP